MQSTVHSLAPRRRSMLLTLFYCIVLWMLALSPVEAKKSGKGKQKASVKDSDVDEQKKADGMKKIAKIMFQMSDKDKDGFLNNEELAGLMGNGNSGKANDMSEDAVDGMDGNGDGLVSLEEAELF